MSKGKLDLSQIMTNNKWVVDEEPHIIVDYEKCEKCDTKACIYMCPAGCYELDEHGKLRFNYEGCLECGTCRLVCNKKAIKWSYPRSGYGIQYRYG
jgi:ferredoxin like protein